MFKSSTLSTPYAMSVQQHRYRNTGAEIALTELENTILSRWWSALGCGTIPEHNGLADLSELTEVVRS